jgi:uncharacterized protein (DUF2461 family)
LGGFRGFGKQALPFFKALKFHQSKEWFEENRALYESDVLGPFTALIDDLSEEFVRRRVPLKGEGRKSIFRIHRDVRFAKDKSPYKTHAGAVMTRSGKKGEQGLLYVHIDPEGCFAAAGFHMLDGPQMTRLPRGYEAFRDTPLAQAFRLKSFIVEEPVKDKAIASPKLVAAIADFAERAMPLLKYGWEALG